jgi:P-type conjugative transfer protein TrbJ
MRNGIALLALSLGVLLAPRPAAAQFGGVTFCTNCSDQVTALSARAQQALQYVQEVQTALKALQMATRMEQEAQQLIQHPSTNIMADLTTLGTIMQQSQGLAGDVMQLSNQFQVSFGTPYNPNPVVAYAAQYSKWATTALNTINGAAKVTGYQNQMLANESNWMAEIQQMNNQQQGRNQSLQLSNTIAIQTVSQLQGLRQLMIADIQSKSAQAASQVSQEQARQTAQQNGLNNFQFSADQRGW